MAVSVLLEADAHIDKQIAELRPSLAPFDYEFVVVDRGTAQRGWLAQQGDVQLLAVNDLRDVSATVHAMARHEARLFLKEGAWACERRTVCEPPALTTVMTAPLLKPSGRTRILHLSSFPSNTQGITPALAVFGEVETFNWEQELKATDAASMNDALKWLCLDFRPDVIFAEETFTGDVWPETLKEIKHLLRVGLANWNGDIRETVPASMVALADVADWTLLSNRAQVRELLHQGKVAAHLPAGCDTQAYRPMEPDRERYPADIVFLGSGGRHYPCSALRAEMVRHLHDRYGDRFAVYGRGWRKHDYPYVRPFLETAAEEAQAYASCKVALGINAFQVEGYTSARMWKAMGSGACYLTHHFPGIEDWFVQQENVTWWRTLGELDAYIDYYLRRDDERQRVAQAGCAKVHQEHSWVARMDTMLRLLRGRKVKVF